ncbi:MAG: SUMF1/EgtB/PvdO family nonheme iron enzyme, partial [Phycisphaerales bacterium]
MNRVIRCAAMAAVVALACGSAAQAVDIQTVSVGNPGNPDDTHGDGYGGVDYEYRIGTFEVTAGQYTAFLNAVAETDTYGLYNTDMSWGCGIQRSGLSGSYAYSVAIDWGDRPVTHVSWGDAARFANWLHNGQPTGTQDFGTTEDGSYLLAGAMTDTQLLAVTRKLNATWVIPSEDEWYKAAYHYNDGVTGSYWDYPTESNAVPTGELPPGTDMVNGSANYDWAVGGTTDVGAYTAKPSDSAYGTFDQGGNMFEWNEAVIGGLNRGARGGSYNYPYGSMLAGIRASFSPTSEHIVGFRVAEVPKVEIQTVRVGNPGNEGELSGVGAGGFGPDRICGAVDYVYNIGTFEVTAGEYTEFLNAVADDDPYGLYNPSMWTSDYGCKIERTGSSPNFSYSVAGDWADRPVNFVSWGDAARFANWLHNGQPTGAQDLTTTEDGSYYLNGATNDAALLAVVREEDATWVIPSEDEWYKGAYHYND